MVAAVAGASMASCKVLCKQSDQRSSATPSPIRLIFTVCGCRNWCGDVQTGWLPPDVFGYGGQLFKKEIWKSGRVTMYGKGGRAARLSVAVQICRQASAFKVGMNLLVS